MQESLLLPLHNNHGNAKDCTADSEVFSAQRAAVFHHLSHQVESRRRTCAAHHFVSAKPVVQGGHSANRATPLCVATAAARLEQVTTTRSRGIRVAKQFPLILVDRDFVNGACRTSRPRASSILHVGIFTCNTSSDLNIRIATEIELDPGPSSLTNH
ncbi:hypothetical protein BST61_g8183 [Cercospora zeina]